MSAIHEDHEPFDEDISVHAAWDVGGGGACSNVLIKRLSFHLAPR